MKRPLIPLGLCAFALVLFACSQSPQLASTPGVSSPVSRSLVLGALELSIDADGQGEVRSQQGVLAAQGVLADNAISFKRLYGGSFDDDVTGQRHLFATFEVTNDTDAPFRNLTFTACSQAGTAVGGTAFKGVTNFGGAPLTDPAVARAIEPEHNMQRTAAGLKVGPGAADFQAVTPGEAAALQTSALAAGAIPAGSEVLEYGFVARNAAGGRTIAAGGGKGQITIALSLPRSRDVGEVPFRFNATWALSDEGTTRVTRGPGETTAEVNARADALGGTATRPTQVMLLGRDADRASCTVPQSCVTTRLGQVRTSAIRYGGPLVITQGGTYSGNWQSLDPSVPAVEVRTSEPVIIENANVRGQGRLIAGFHLNITVRNTRGYGLNANPSDQGPREFLLGEEVYHVYLENNYFENANIYIRHFKGDPAKGQTIKILRNQARNVQGKRSFVQFNDVKDIQNVQIAWNEVINLEGQSYVEDNINFRLSTGTAGSPIRVHDNYIQGAFAPNPVSDDYSGGGILADCGSSYIHAYDNQLVHLGGHGVSIGGGHDNLMEKNRVISTNAMPDGTLFKIRANGGYVWNGPWCNEPGGGFYNNVIRDSTFGVVGPAVFWDRQRAGLWAPDCATDATGGPRCTGHTIIYDPVTPDTEAAEFVRWLHKLSQQGIRVGPGF